MDFTRRTDYALRLIARLARTPDAPLSVRQVADAEDIPYAFARGIQHDLVLAGLVNSKRGVGGGMVLASSPRALTLLDVISALDGGIHVSSCTGEGLDCPREEGCPYHEVWQGANELLEAYYASITIADLLDGKRPHVEFTVESVAPHAPSSS